MDVASLNPRPRVRNDVVKIHQVARGQPFYIYKVPGIDDYYHLDEIQHEILSLLDGTRTLEQVVEELGARSAPIPLDLEFLQDYINNLRSTEILERSREERRRLFLEKIRDQRRRRASGRGRFGNILDISVSAWNPDRFFDRVLPWVRFFWSPGFLLLSAAAVLVMLGIWSSEWDRIRRGTLEMFTFRGKSGSDILQFFLILMVVGFLHESAHGLTCKYFGGHVTRMGFMLIYFTPCFFVEVGDAFMFDTHFARQAVIYAGGYIELVMCSISTFVWSLTSPGTLVNDVAWKFLLMTGLTSIIINYNPLIKLDGYYSLMDYLEIPDLWERSFGYLSDWIKKNIFRLPADLEAPPRQVRRILVGYALLSLAYKTLIITVFVIFLRNVLLSLFGPFGYLVLSATVVIVLRRQLRALAGFLKFWVLDKKEALMNRRSITVAGTACVLLVATFFLVPVPIVVRGACVLEPRSVAFVRCTEEGTVERVLVEEGQEIQKGQALAILRNDRLSRELQIASARRAVAEAEVARAAGTEDRGVLAKKAREMELQRDEVRVLQERVQALTLRSPIAGVAATSRLGDRLGSYVRAGESFCEVTGRGNLIARIPVREMRLDEVAPGQRAVLNLVAFPFRTFRGTVVALAPAARQRGGKAEEGTVAESPERGLGKEFTDFDAIVSMAGPMGELKDGMAGTARIRIGRSTLAQRAARAFRRWVGSRIW